MKKRFDRGGEPLRVGLDALGEGRYRVQVGDSTHEVDAVRLPDGRVRFTLDGVTHEAAAGNVGRVGVHVRLDDATWMLTAHTGGGAAAAVAGDGTITAPMTGTVLKINVSVGQEVHAEETVAVVSAMKMEHKLPAGVAGTVVEIAVDEGATIDQGALILRIEQGV